VAGISRWTISRVNCLWRTTGDVVQESILQGQPRVLSSLDVNVRT
jgi:hypothetical protein